MIYLSNVYRYYHKVEPALNNINLTIEKGEFVFLTGASGAGKTTLLRLIFGEERGDEGQLRVNGQNVFQLKEREIPLLRRRIGFIFQDFKLIWSRTVFENVALPLAMIGTARSQIKKRVDEILQMVRLEGHARKRPGTLSAGEQQRVSIARAMVNYPLILLADEPTGNLDDALSKDILDVLKDINSKGTTVIVATHQQSAIDHIPARTVTLDHGSIVSDTGIQ